MHSVHKSQIFFNKLLMSHESFEGLRPERNTDMTS